MSDLICLLAMAWMVFGVIGFGVACILAVAWTLPPPSPRCRRRDRAR